MATPSRRTDASLADRLARSPYEFEFFQAVRLLERLQRQQSGAEAPAETAAVGEDGPPEREAVRFRALASQIFPACEITAVDLPAELAPARSAETGAGLPESLPGEREVRGLAGPAQMEVAFMGLTGPSGVLPQHYTQLVIDRLRSKDTSLRDFLDLFNHRLIALFYRSWVKYRLPMAFERCALRPPPQPLDPFTRSLYSLVGLGTEHLRGRLEIPDEAFLYYAGHFAHRPRSAAGLESVLGDYFQLPVRAIQFQGQWLYLDPQDQTRMPSNSEPRGRNRRLGTDAVVGQRVWSVESRFRLRLGPLGYEEFRRFLPTGDGLVPICQLARSYVGPEYDFDIQPVLHARETPRCRLGGSSADGSYLGWNSWVSSMPRRQDAQEAVFLHDGFPLESA